MSKSGVLFSSVELSERLLPAMESKENKEERHDEENDFGFYKLGVRDWIGADRETLYEGEAKLISYNYRLKNGKTKEFRFIFSEDTISKLSPPLSHTEEKCTDERKIQFMQQIAAGLFWSYTYLYRNKYTSSKSADLVTIRAKRVEELEGTDSNEPVTFYISDVSQAPEDKYKITYVKRVGEVKQEATLTTPLALRNESQLRKFKPTRIGLYDEDYEVVKELGAVEHYEAKAFETPVPPALPSLASTVAAMALPVVTAVAERLGLVSAVTSEVKREGPVVAETKIPSPKAVVASPSSEIKAAPVVITPQAKLLEKIKSILGKDVFWMEQASSLSDYVPERIRKMRNAKSSLAVYARIASDALKDKSWYQKCCSCLFAKPVLRSKATQDFYKIISRATTASVEDLNEELTRWQRRYGFINLPEKSAMHRNNTLNPKKRVTFNLD